MAVDERVIFEGNDTIDRGITPTGQVRFDYLHACSSIRTCARPILRERHVVAAVGLSYVADLLSLSRRVRLSGANKVRRCQRSTRGEQTERSRAYAREFSVGNMSIVLDMTIKCEHDTGASLSKYIYSCIHPTSTFLYASRLLFARFKLGSNA